jgi:hypothetical protein
MTDGKNSRVPISEIHSEEGAQDLVRSEKMKPYLAFLKAQMSGQDTEPYLAALAALPLEERYVWRVISAMKWAFCDLDCRSPHSIGGRSQESAGTSLIKSHSILSICQRADWRGGHGTDYAARGPVRKGIIRAGFGRIAGPWKWMGTLRYLALSRESVSCRAPC